MDLASYQMREINRKSDRFKKRYSEFLFRINRKLNSGQALDLKEQRELQTIYERVTEPPRLKW